MYCVTIKVNKRTRKTVYLICTESGGRADYIIHYVQTIAAAAENNTAVTSQVPGTI